MTFNDTTTKDGLIQDCERWVFGSNYGAISSNANMLYTFTSLLNYGVDRTSIKIMENDNRWQYDDSNFTDFPEATTNLSDGQQTYLLDNTFIKIEGIEVMDSTGHFFKVNKIDKEEIRRRGYSLSEYYKDKGMPIEYDVEGNVLTLYPAPATGSVTMTGGLKAVFQRPSSYFVSTDTTKTTGVASPFQDMPVLYACQKYAKQNSMTDKARELDMEVLKRENEMEIFFSNRWKDDKTQLKTIYRRAR